SRPELASMRPSQAPTATRSRVLGSGDRGRDSPRAENPGKRPVSSQAAIARKTSAQRRRSIKAASETCTVDCQLSTVDFRRLPSPGANRRIQFAPTLMTRSPPMSLGRFPRWLWLVLALAMAPSTAHAQLARSWNLLPTGNGHGFQIFDRTQDKITYLLE